MNWYFLVFERIYSLYNRTTRANSSEMNWDSAFYACCLFAVPVIANLVSLFHIYRLIIDETNLKLGINGGIVAAILIVINMIVFLRKKKYIEIRQKVLLFSKTKMRNITIFAWIYIIGSVILFFALLIGTSPG